ncbi:glycosyltransferase family 9 protein [Hymenobacter busanensis]|uniref:Glycosyltransferase family 9 protein n=1 Tax=Hymenobacter busanensis TaxID=2607656 RepID=A0A7L4ZZC4_9BACT|nr:glycosyltransferase family 9 protein [Hymenobacter busanensis]KAA9338695.1 glycosyltransferase family 9 protein [Hymenobacter busanensis]QHJ08874.1 glycosyl transferase family 9 [Hymenobacter busanensis]
MKTFLVSRTDAIGDLVLTLPVCGWLKQRYPGCRVVVLGRDYTRAVAAACPAVDSFISDDDLQKLPEQEQIAALQQIGADAILHVFPSRRLASLARKAQIPVRIGTRSRWFHWLTCNRLVALSRRHSPLHEAQLNMQLLRPLGLAAVPSLSELVPLGRLVPAESLASATAQVLQRQSGRQLNIILHPRSRGHGREWGLAHFGALARTLQAQGHRVFVTGTQAEGDSMREWLQEHAAVLTDLTGQLNLPQFLAFIGAADGLVASGTGPLHLAAALGRQALGLFPPMRPIHPGRWAPLGPRAEYLVFDKPDCQDCRADAAACTCIKALQPVQVLARIAAWEPLPPAYL